MSVRVARKSSSVSFRLPSVPNETGEVNSAFALCLMNLVPCERLSGLVPADVTCHGFFLAKAMLRLHGQDVSQDRSMPYASKMYARVRIGLQNAYCATPSHVQLVMKPLQTKGVLMRSHAKRP